MGLAVGMEETHLSQGTQRLTGKTMSLKVSIARFHFGKRVDFRGYPSPSRSIGISDIAENLEKIYGAQELRGKILSRKDLDLTYACLFTRLSLWL